MPLFTLDEVRQTAASATDTLLVEGEIAIASRAETLFEQRANAARLAPPKHFNIFLSYAYSNKALVAGPYSMLTSTEFVVHVDWIHDRHRLNRNVDGRLECLADVDHHTLL